MSDVEADIIDSEAIYHCWLVWKLADDGGRPYLVAVDTLEETAKRHEIMVKDEARLVFGLPEGKIRSLVQIERSFLNHAYGESMGQGYDRMKALAQEIRRATIDELEEARKRITKLEKGIRSILHANKDDGMEDPEERIDAALEALKALVELT